MKLDILKKQKWEKFKMKMFLKMAALSIGILLVACLLYMVVVPVASRIIITKLLELRNDTHILSQWLHQPEPLITRMYLWNLTNAADVDSGLSSPIFNEVGPYVYEQYTEKIPTEFKENSIVYYSRTTYTFREDLTEPATLDDEVMTLHAGLYGAAGIVENNAPSMVSFINEAIPYLFPGVNSVFVRVRVGSFLFDGLPLNCSNTESSTAAMVCSALPNYAPPTIRQKENSPDFLFSFFAHKNNTLQGPYEEDRGTLDIRQVGNLMNLHNTSELGVWQQHSKCDRLRGSDTHTFSPFVTTSDIIEIFIPDVCQIIPVSFEEETSLQDLLVYKFILTESLLQSVEKNPENICFCLEDKDQFCHHSGVRDVSSCVKAPVIMSLPHFYQADPQFLEYAKGLNPDRDRHTSVLYIEPQTGAPVKAAKRLQMNMYLKRIEGFQLVENVSEGLFPLIWLEESILVTDAVLAAVKQPLAIQKAVNITCLILMVITTLTTCFALVAFVHQNRIWCFQYVTTNQVTALFYKSSPEGSQIKTDTISAVAANPWITSQSHNPSFRSEQSKAHHVTTNEITESFFRASLVGSQVKKDVVSTNSPNPNISFQAQSTCSDQGKAHHVTTNQITNVFSRHEPEGSKVKADVWSAVYPTSRAHSTLTASPLT